MAGYYKDPESTAKALQGGWFHTGDIGTLNLDGCLTITDRKKDLIKTTGGKLVAPQPIEAQLQQDPLIDRVVLVGDGRHYVVALVVPSWAYLSTRGMTGNPLKLVHDQDVIALVQERIDSVNSGRANWEQIKYFRLIADDFSIEAGELTPKMSIRRRQIQENHRQLIDEMYRSRSA
jgi:long-chain acyl-CoA synthetase